MLLLVKKGQSSGKALLAYRGIATVVLPREIGDNDLAIGFFDLLNFILNCFGEKFIFADFTF